MLQKSRIFSFFVQIKTYTLKINTKLLSTCFIGQHSKKTYLYKVKKKIVGPLVRSLVHWDTWQIYTHLEYNKPLERQHMYFLPT